MQVRMWAAREKKKQKKTIKAEERSMARTQHVHYFKCFLLNAHGGHGS